MKIFRWTGFVSFVVVIGVIAAGILFFLESYVKSLAESKLTEANGAKVEIDDLDISYVPLSIEIRNLQVADSNQPMTNSVQISKIIMGLSTGDLLLKKLNVEKLSIEGIQVDTARESSGEIKKMVVREAVPEKSEASVFEVPEIKIPDVNELLKKEPLKSEKMIAELDKDIENTSKLWRATKENLTDKNRWDKYDAKYKKIQKDFKGNFVDKLKAAKSAKDLIKSLKKEAENIKLAKKQIKTDISRLNESFKQVKKAPADDIRRIKEKYQLDDIGSGNITQLLFGTQTAEHIATAKKWYERIKPYLEGGEEEDVQETVRVRSKGQDIRFREYDPKPDFYAQKAFISADLPRGQFVGEILEISSDQSINKKPTRFLIEGKNLSSREQEKISGEINYVKKSHGFSKLDYVISKYQVIDYALSKSEKLPIAIDKGLMDFGLKVKLQNDELAGSVNADFEKVVFVSKAKQGSSLASMISSSFTDINQFNINAKFKGSFDDLSLRLSSDLDNKIGDKFKERLNQKTKDFEEDLKRGIRAKLKAPMDKIEKKRQQLEQVKAQINRKEQEIKQKLNKLKI